MIVMTAWGRKGYTHTRACPCTDQIITLSCETLDAAGIKQMTETRLDWI